MYTVTTPTSADRRNARADARQAERDARNAEAAEASLAAGYPELDGTPAQVSWATTIRYNVMSAASDRLTATIAAGDATSALMVDILDSFLTQTRASWWIDNGRGIALPLADGSLESVSTFDVALMRALRGAA
jgi:hypothetical protein